MTKQDTLLNEIEAAKYAKVSVSYLRKLRHHKNKPDYIKLGKTVRYSQQALDTWIAENTRKCMK